MPVARDLAHRVIEQRDLHDARQTRQRLQVLPLRDVVVVQVQELQTPHPSKHLARGQALQLVVRKVNFFQTLETNKVGQVLHLEQVVLQVDDRELGTALEDLEALAALAVAE